MQLTESDLDPFCAWLCEHEHDVVGRPGMTYYNPLAQWLISAIGSYLRRRWACVRPRLMCLSLLAALAALGGGLCGLV